MILTGCPKQKCTKVTKKLMLMITVNNILIDDNIIIENGQKQ